MQALVPALQNDTGKASTSLQLSFLIFNRVEDQVETLDDKRLSLRSGEKGNKSTALNWVQRPDRAQGC